ncbi:hypothetical protein ACLOJK_012424 [Asimina triloba]
MAVPRVLPFHPPRRPAIQPASQQLIWRRSRKGALFQAGERAAASDAIIAELNFKAVGQMDDRHVAKSRSVKVSGQPASVALDLGKEAVIADFVACLIHSARKCPCFLSLIPAVFFDRFSALVVLSSAMLATPVYPDHAVLSVVRGLTFRI